MNVVTEVQPKGEKNALLVMSDGGAPIWTPDIEKAKTLLGKAIPGDWTQKEGPYGPQVLPPRDGKGPGQAAYRNTKEGQAYEQERMDRRTALMQAVAYETHESQQPPLWRAVEDYADAAYAWLRATVGGSTAPSSSSARRSSPHEAAPPTPSADQQAQGETTPGREGSAVDGGGGSEPGEGPGSSPTTLSWGDAIACEHPEGSRTGFKADGTPLPTGFLRCGLCGALTNKQGVFK